MITTYGSQRLPQDIIGYETFKQFEYQITRLSPASKGVSTLTLLEVLKKNFLMVKYYLAIYNYKYYQGSSPCFFYRKN